MVSWMHPEKKAVSRLNSDALVTQLPSNSLPWNERSNPHSCKNKAQSSKVFWAIQNLFFRGLVVIFLHKKRSYALILSATAPYFTRTIWRSRL